MTGKTNDSLHVKLYLIGVSQRLPLLPSSRSCQLHLPVRTIAWADYLQCSALAGMLHVSRSHTLSLTSIISFLLGIGVGAEYPCGSVAASEQSEEEGIAKNAQHRWFALATSECWKLYSYAWASTQICPRRQYD